MARLPRPRGRMPPTRAGGSGGAARPAPASRRMPSPPGATRRRPVCGGWTPTVSLVGRRGMFFYLTCPCILSWSLLEAMATGTANGAALGRWDTPKPGPYGSGRLAMAAQRRRAHASRRRSAELGMIGPRQEFVLMHRCCRTRAGGLVTRRLRKR